jgi:hypothetical protein
MKGLSKYFIILTLLVAAPTELFCQPDLKDSTEAYNYWVQRGVTEIIYSMMEDFPKRLTDAEQAGKELYFEKFIDGIDKRSLSGIVKTFGEIEEFLKGNSYGNTARNIFLPLKTAFEQRKPFDDQFFTLISKYENSVNFDRKKTELLDGYKRSLEDLARVVQRVAEPGTIQAVAPFEPPEEKSVSVWVWIVTGFLAGLVGGAALIYYYSRSRIYSILKIEKKKYLSDLKKDQGQDIISRKYFSYVGLVSLLKDSKDRKSEALEKRREELVRLEDQNEVLRNETAQKDKIIASLKSAAEYRASDRGHSEGQPGKSYGIPVNKMEIYFTIPESDGSFKTSNARDGQDAGCFYKIEPDRSGQKGRLSFISGEYDLRALDNIDYYLNPVCEIQNIADRTFARKILMTDTGSVIKRGDYWKIEDNNKIKIKLVS